MKKKQLKNLAFSLLFAGGVVITDTTFSESKNPELMLKIDEKGQASIEYKHTGDIKNHQEFADFSLSPMEGQKPELSFSKSREEGESELMNAALNKDKEDIWAFYEEEGSGRWTDCGCKEESNRAGINLDEILNQNFNNAILTFYHIHPIKPGKKLFEREYNKLSQQYDSLDPNDKIRKIDKNKLIFSILKTGLPILINANPSYRDFLLYKALEAGLKERGIKTVPSRVVTPEGVFEFACGSNKDSEIKERYVEFMDKIYKTKEIDASKSFEYKKDDFLIRFTKKRDISSEEFYKNIR